MFSIRKQKKTCKTGGKVSRTCIVSLKELMTVLNVQSSMV